jgi:hypothetical protein
VLRWLIVLVSFVLTAALMAGAIDPHHDRGLVERDAIAFLAAGALVAVVAAVALGISRWRHSRDPTRAVSRTGRSYRDAVTAVPVVLIALLLAGGAYSGRKAQVQPSTDDPNVTNSHGEDRTKACYHFASDELKAKQDLRKHNASVMLADLQQLRQDDGGLRAFADDAQLQTLGQLDQEDAMAARAIEDYQAGHLQAAQADERKVLSIRNSLDNPTSLGRIGKLCSGTGIYSP